MLELDSTYTLPRHIAVIMDGNGRWAKKRGATRIFGHRSATKSVREVTEECAELGVEFLTLYAFSTENWGRPKVEVDALMELLVSSLRKELKTLMKNNVKLNAIGDILGLPDSCRNELKETIHALAKIRNGTFGICEKSADPIPVERLRVNPIARCKVIIED